MSLTATWHSAVRFPEADGITESAPELLRRLVAADPGRARVIDAEQQVTAAALLRAAAADQARLRAVGVRRGDVVCMQLPNWWEAVALAHAVWGMGGILCPVPVNFRTTEVASILSSTAVAAYIAPARYRNVGYPPLIAAAMQRAGVSAPLLAVPRTGLAAHGRAADAGPELDAGLDAVCMLMFTSGTTGRPKGVLHSHRTLLAEAASIAGLFGMRQDRVYMPSPIGHITGLVYGVLMPLLMDGTVVLQADWDPEDGVALVERHRCTVCVGATPFLRGLSDANQRRGQPSALRAFICGGADVPPSLVREAERSLGAVVVRAYGLTEMPTVSCGGPGDGPEVRADTDGRLTGSSQARLAHAVDGVGELEVRGPELCLGYLDPADTAAAFTADGWFRTGDLARLGPDRTVTIAGRVKDIVVRGGENISTKEVEDYLAEYPPVAEAAIVGVPDPVLGERACVFVVASGQAPSLADISAYLISRDIAKQKVPEHLIIVSELPRTPSGKIQKFLLGSEARKLLAAGQGESR